MKMTELRCSACDGTLKIDQENPGIAECEYCHTKYSIEWDRAAGGAGGTGNPYLKPMPGRINYQPVQRQEPKKTGWEPYGWKRGVALAVGFLVIMAVWKGPAVYRRYQMDHAAEESAEAAGKPGLSGSGTSGAMENAGSQEEAGKPEVTGLLADFSEALYGKPVDEITDSEFGKIRWLEMKSTIDYREVGYSFEDPLENPDARLTWLKFPRDTSVDLSCLPAFTGLTSLGAGQSVGAEDLKGLSLTRIRGYFDSMEQVASILEEPGNLLCLETIGSPFSIQGIEAFSGLESLIIDSDQILEERLLVNARSLKEISVDLYEGTMDFTLFGMMPWLESLTISSKELRDLGFVSKMENLKALHVEYGAFLSVAPLSGRPELVELSLERCDELKDMSAVGGLTGLQKLKIDLPYDCPPPDLSGLTGMKELYLEGFEETGFLRAMGGLESLTLDGCIMNNPSDFEGLTSLRTLTCTSFTGSERDYSFITRLTALEELDMRGMATYKDISGIFNLPSLKKVNISNMECEINFDKIAENTTLEELGVDHMKLYKNVQVSGGGGIQYVNWDDVSFTKHVSFLGKFQGLKHLSIRENELTDLAFAAQLPALQTLDFSDNYVTDLSPLAGLKALTQIDCTKNPVSNYEVLGSSVVVIR